jgi:hypothetical protein
MLETLFMRFLEISAATGVIILGLFLFAPYLGRNFAAKWKYRVWLLLAVRLLVPLTISLPAAPLAGNIPNPPVSYNDVLSTPPADAVTTRPDAAAIQPDAGTVLQGTAIVQPSPPSANTTRGVVGLFRTHCHNMADRRLRFFDV